MLLRAGLIVALIASAFPSSAPAACLPQQPFCYKLPNKADKDKALFVGTVRRVTLLIRRPAQSSPDVQQADTIRQARRRVGTPPAIENKEYPILELDVTENFLNAASAEFTVWITSDVFINGIPQGIPSFREGEVWLIEAYYDAQEQHWMTSACQRTKLAAQSTENLRVLRAWRDGNRLTGRVTGYVSNFNRSTHVSGVRVTLHGSRGTRVAVTDGSGQFSFDEVDSGLYEAAAEGGQSVTADLRSSWCSHIALVVKQD